MSGVFRGVMRRAPALLAAALTLLALGAPARGALPPAAGGTLRLPSPAPITTLDPLRARTHFEATLTRAIFDGLYERNADGVIAPVLADGMPEIEGATATIRLLPGVRHHGGGPLTARHVVRSLRRLTRTPRASWLLTAFRTEGGRVAVRALDSATLELELAHPQVRIERVLAAPPLAIVVGGNLTRRPLGTGPFRARLDGQGGVALSAFADAVEGPPWLRTVQLAPPVDRDEEIRAFELGRLDGSWWGESLYGGAPVRPTRRARIDASAAVLLVPNRAGALRADERLGGVVAAIDRQRLERVGLTPRATLDAGLPAPTLPTRGALRRGSRLKMLVRAGHPLEVRLGEALAGLLDERGARLSVERVDEARYERAVARGEWDLRLALVRPPLDGPAAYVAAALAAIGETDRARRVAARLDDAEGARAASRALGAMVLGHERVVLHHRADLVGLRLDSRGRVPLADLSLARGAEERP